MNVSININPILFVLLNKTYPDGNQLYWDKYLQFTYRQACTLG